MLVKHCHYQKSNCYFYQIFSDNPLLVYHNSVINVCIWTFNSPTSILVHYFIAKSFILPIIFALRFWLKNRLPLCKRAGWQRARSCHPHSAAQTQFRSSVSTKICCDLRIRMTESKISRSLHCFNRIDHSGTFFP